MNFVTHTLGEICDEVGGIIKTGPFGSQLHKSDYRDEGMPVIMPKDLIEGKVSVRSIARIGDEDVARLSRHQLKAGDIVYARRGDIGRRALITSREAGWICGTGCMRISLGDSVVHSVFLHYYLGQPDVVTWIYNQAVGATMPNLNTSIVRSIPITYPPLPTQRKIAAILSAYDNLIENNTRRIAILEEMAQAIYREWFVHFRFPGHEQVAMVDSELGPIPEGWEVRQLGQLGELNKEKFCEDTHSDLPLLDLAKMLRRTLSVGEMGSPGELSTSRIIFKEDDILFGSIRPYLHKVALAPCQGVTNVSVLVIRPVAEVYKSLLAVLLSSVDAVRWAEQHSTGTKMPVIKWDIFRTMPVLLPEESILGRFHEVVYPMLQTVKMTCSRNHNLRRTRDLLLPRLIAGEVDVSELEINTGGLDQ